MTLELAGIGKEVGGQVWIHPTDLTLAPGTMNVLLGPTLSGKTTLMPVSYTHLTLPTICSV